jgi:tRNA threonylcarbamoyladenosine biosynthesis protein TsaE
MIYSLDAIATAATYILQHIPNSKVITFTAAMGAGKTTLIAEICKQLQVQDRPSSPTFSIINTYITNGNEQVYHLDLYRVKDIEEALLAGVEEAVYSNTYCFVEWPQLIADILPKDTLHVSIEMVDAYKRELRLVATVD